MNPSHFKVFAVCLTIGLLGPTPLLGAPPWHYLVPFQKKVDADPNKSYEITEDNGPWMILAATFTNEHAERDAHELVLELRQRYNLRAYIHRQDYDFTEPVIGNGIDRYGNPRRMRYANPTRFTGVGVLVGNYATFDDPDGQNALERIKYARPNCLNMETGKWTVQRWAVFQELRRTLNINDERTERGPLGSAFITRNPLLPEEYFRPGMDPFIVEMNQGVEFSLLENPGKYTVQVATFSGETTMDLNKISQQQRRPRISNKLEVGAEKAHRLANALRRRGVEAYEFHDRHASIVTVGSFDWITRTGPDGTPEVHPGMMRVMKQFQAEQHAVHGENQVAFQPHVVEGIHFDIQPEPIEVPKRRARSAYFRRPFR